MVRPRLRSSEEHSEDLRTALDSGQSAERAEADPARPTQEPGLYQDFTSQPNKLVYM